MADKDRAGSSDKHEQKVLDKAIEDSFPASDPPSMTRAPRDEVRPTAPPPDGDKAKSRSR